MENGDYEKIIPTAWLTAYPRIFTDIPFSKDIFDQLEQIKREKGLPEVSEDLKVPNLAPELEARYKLGDKLLYNSGLKQILEIAPGLSQRGIIMAKDPSITYVEMDLPKMMIYKREIINRLISSSKINSMPNLYLEDGNALNMQDLIKATSHFEKKPIAIIHEGLLRYLDLKEKAIVAKNIYSLLERFGGVWITPDITLKKFLEVQNKTTMPGKNEYLINLTGRDYATENKFENVEHAKQFFESFGFTVEQHKLTEVQNELTSPKELNISQEEVEELIKVPFVFVMRIKSSEV